MRRDLYIQQNQYCYSRGLREPNEAKLSLICEVTARLSEERPERGRASLEDERCLANVICGRVTSPCQQKARQDTEYRNLDHHPPRTSRGVLLPQTSKLGQHIDNSPSHSHCSIYKSSEVIMARPKRPLSQIDPNAPVTSGQPKSKAAKLANSKPSQTTNIADHGKHYIKRPPKRRPGEHPEIDKDIAERFEKRGPSFRIIETYKHLQVAELKELAGERGLKLSGKKDDLIDRLESYDEEHPSGKKKVGDDHREALARQPVPIGAKASKMGPKDDMFETMSKQGPNGPPIYDELGFELDYKRCTGGPSSKDAMLDASERVMDRMERETAAKVRVTGMKKAAFEDIEDAWDDRVSRDLGIPFHMVGSKQYQEWKRKGFKADPKEIEKIAEQDSERLDFLVEGCSLRKGSVK